MTAARLAVEWKLRSDPGFCGPDAQENGKFAWTMDPEGNKVELWQPMAWDEKSKGS